MMTDAPNSRRERVQEITQQLAAGGHVHLVGTESDATARWLKRRRAQRTVYVVSSALGIAAILIGIAFHEFAGWMLLILAGFFAALFGLVGTAVLAAHSRMMRPRALSEREPVVLSPQGAALRGIGPVPWHHLEPPRRTRVPVKNDIGGDCLVMTFTPEGHAFANQRAGWWSNRIGPKPYLRLGIPHLLLPGIEGLSDDDVMELFRLAHRMFTGG